MDPLCDISQSPEDSALQAIPFLQMTLRYSLDWQPVVEVTAANHYLLMKELCYAQCGWGCPGLTAKLAQDVSWR